MGSAVIAGAAPRYQLTFPISRNRGMLLCRIANDQGVLATVRIAQ